jgi:hypothetical protein
MRTSEETAELFQALVALGGDLKNPTADQTAKVKTKTGADYSYKYPAFDQIVTDARALLNKHNLAALQETVSQQIDSVDGDGKPTILLQVGVTTRIIHNSGEWIETGPLFLPAGAGPQEHGSAITYARRYSLSAALLVAAEEDDDGASAQKSGAGDKAPRVTGKGTDSPSPAPDTTAEGKFPYLPKDCPHLKWVISPTNPKFEVCPGCGEARMAVTA